MTGPPGRSIDQLDQTAMDQKCVLLRFPDLNTTPPTRAVPQVTVMKSFKNMLVIVGPDDSEATLNRAFEIATESKARITLMDVIKPLPKMIGMMPDVPSCEELAHALAAERSAKLKAIAERFSSSGVDVDVHVAIGNQAHQIVRRVLREEHDIVFKTAWGKKDRSLSPACRALVRLCPCPVWVLKPQVHGEFDQILAAIDVDDDDEVHRKLNNTILELAYSVAQRDNAMLHVVSAWDLWMEQALRRRSGDAEVDATLRKHEMSVRQSLDHLLQSPEASASDVQVHLHRGQAAQVIMGVAEKVEADLIVMGTVCRTGVAGFIIGNTAENLLSEVTCSILAIKPEGFETPVAVELDELISGDQSMPLY
jgi:nucleotide-binding universal stress UspA family protein